MTSYFVYMGKELLNSDVSSLVETINPCKTLKTRILKANQGLFGVSFLEDAPLKGKRYFEDKNWIAVFAGDLIEESFPWKRVLEALENENYKVLASFNGYFSIAVLNKKENRLFIISDRRSQFPVFYLINDVNICISTELSTFCRLPVAKEFDIEWLWEYLFFSIPIGQTTFFKNVKRMPPASVLEIDIESGQYSFLEYAVKFRKKKQLLEGKEALEYAYNVFRSVMPKYFTGASDIAFSLTCGWDTRTNLSFCPNLDHSIAYTYGVPECSDLVEASKTAQALNIKHQKILFDKHFEEKLPSLMFETIRISSGLERITRSTLLHVYRNLTDSGTKHPVVISGIDFDELFRGHLGRSFLMPDLQRTFSAGEKGINEDFWEDVMGVSYDPFRRHILKQIDNLERKYGKLSEPESHLSYVLYESAPNYFSGETAIAKHFTTLRVPGWDNDIIDLSYSIEYSTLSFSEFLPHHKRGSMEEMILQAYLISKNNRTLRNIPVYGVPPKIFSKGKIAYNLVRIKNLGPKRIKNILLNKSDIPLEDWNKWLNGVLKSIINKLVFSEDSMVKEYVHPEYLNSLKNRLSDPIIPKLVTAEIILKSFFKNQKDTFYHTSS